MDLKNEINVFFKKKMDKTIAKYEDEEILSEKSVGSLAK